MRTEAKPSFAPKTMANPPTVVAEISSAQQVNALSIEDDDHNESLLTSSAALTQQGEGGNESSWNEMLFGTLFSKKPEPKRRIVKAIPPHPSALPPTPVQENGKDKDDHPLNDEDDAQVDPVQWQKLDRRRSAQERQRKLHTQMLQERRFASSPKTPPAEKVANPMSRFLSVFSIRAHPEHKRRAGPSTRDEDEDSALFLSPKRPRPMEEEQTDDAVTPTAEPKERASKQDARHRGAYVGLAFGIVATGFFFFFCQRQSRHARPQIEL
jgi:hypothetical protein